MKQKPFDANKVLEAVHDVAKLYGFTKLSEVLHAKGRTRSALPADLPMKELDTNGEDVAHFLNALKDAGVVVTSQNPQYLWHTNITPGRKSSKNATIQFYALGAERALGDVVVMRAMQSLMHEIAKKETVLTVNSMGDKETRARYGRDLQNFFRKNALVFSQECMQLAKLDVFKATSFVPEEAGLHVPYAADHLSESSRKHFEHVLDYLENTDTPYTLNRSLMMHAPLWQETCFEITTEDNSLKAAGARVTDFTRYFFKQQPVHAVGSILRLTLDNKTLITPLKKKRPAKYALVHIGEEAKRMSMKLTDGLRRAKIACTQVLGLESLTEQMRHVEADKPTHVLVIGRPEALAGRVILRERETFAEQYIPIAEVVSRLKTVA